MTEKIIAVSEKGEGLLPMKQGKEQEEDKSLEELTEAGFVKIPRTFPKLMFQTDGKRTMIYSFAGLIRGEEDYRLMYDGENQYVRGLIDKE